MRGRNGSHEATVVASLGNSEERDMGTRLATLVWTVGLMGVSAAAFAGDDKRAHPQEPVGFVAGGVIGAFAAGPIGAVVGAGLGTWLGNRVHRAGDASKAETRAAALQSETETLQSEAQALQTEAQALQTEKAVLLTEKTQLLDSNQTLSAKLNDLSQSIATAQTAKVDASQALDGLEGDILFRTGSAEITPDIAHQIQVLAQAVAKSTSLKIRVDGYADPRGTEESNMQLSQDRANAVRDLLLAAGVREELLEVNAYGKSQSTAADADGYALERRVRLTLEMQGPAAVAQVSGNE
jgi:outer membrane protein OmpA-like peptidoglycan-associated protein